MVLRSVLFLFLSSTTLFAINGRVERPDGTPVADATVVILGESGSARTDAQGRFAWAPVPRPPFEVVVSLSNGELLAPVFVTSLPVEGLWVVVVEPVTSDSITVTGGLAPNIDAPPASGLKTLTKADLASSGPARLIDAVESVAGVNRISDGHAAVPAVRGLARGRTLLLVDGGRVTTERRAGPSATFLDPFFLEAVEVARGPGSVAYGSDAFGGVIHARTRQVEPGSPLTLRLQGTLGAGIPERSTGLVASQGFSDGGIQVMGSFRQFDDYDSPGGVIDNSSARGRSYLFGGNQEVGPGRLTVSFQDDQGRDVGRPRNNSSSTRFFYPEENSRRFSAGYELDPTGGFSRLHVDFFLGRSQLVTVRDSIPSPSENRIRSVADVEANDYGVRAVAIRPLPHSRLEIGVDFNGRFDLSARDEEEIFDSSDRLVRTEGHQSIIDASRFNSAGYASLEIAPIETLSLSGGVRLDRITTRNRGGAFGDLSTSNTSVSGFGSVSVRPFQGLKLTAQLARGFRDPTLSDRYFQGLTGRGEATGNPDLEPEKSLQFDFSARYARSKGWLAFYVYRYRIEDLVERFEAGDDLFFFRNRGHAIVKGVEVEAGWDLTDRTSLSLTAENARGSAEDQSALDDISTATITLTARRKLGTRGFVGLTGRLFDRDTRPGPTERVQPGYGILSLTSGWRLGESYLITFRLKNLLDKDYPLSPDRRSIDAPGISASVTLSLAF